ncbi:MAG: alpha/beta hydrolase [Myxococcota bacterium]
MITQPKQAKLLAKAADSIRLDPEKVSARLAKGRRWALMAGIVVLAGLAASELLPDSTAALMLWGLRSSAGLSAKTVNVSFGTVHYLEGGEGETVVALHGIYARKEHWIDMSRALVDENRLILLDLPGFGANRRLEASEYDYSVQTMNVIEVLNALDAERFHLVANSMGAQIATMLATTHPDRVQSVSFIGSPVGVSSPTPSDMETAIANGATPLVVRKHEDYHKRMAWLFPKTPFIPRPVSRSWAKQEVAEAEHNRAVWDAVGASRATPVEGLAPQVEVPALIIWCRDDRIFHVSGAKVLEAALPDVKLITPSGCGHLPMLDRPEQTGHELRDFLAAAR